MKRLLGAFGRWRRWVRIKGADDMPRDHAEVDSKNADHNQLEEIVLNLPGH